MANQAVVRDNPEGLEFVVSGPVGRFGVKLTPRDLLALGCLLHGDNGPEMAERLKVSAASAKRYVMDLYSKFAVNDRLKLVLLVLRHREIAKLAIGSVRYVMERGGVKTALKQETRPQGSVLVN